MELAVEIIKLLVAIVSLATSIITLVVLVKPKKKRKR